MNIKVAIPKEEYERLKENSVMLDKIADVVRQHATKEDYGRTTLESVLALNERVRNLNKKVRALKQNTTHT
mgnify:CR=1 FL=1